jgi:hypothetical protein
MQATVLEPSLYALAQALFQEAEHMMDAKRLDSKLTLGLIFSDFKFKLRPSLPFALLGRFDGAHALFNDSTSLTVPARDGAPLPRGRCPTMDAANTLARHCVIAALHSTVFARGPAPLFARRSRRLLLLARAQQR